MRRLKKVLKVLLIIYGLVTVMLYFFQEKLIFLPTSLPSSHTYTFSEPYEELFLNAADGASLNALHFKKENPKGLLLYFHGNAGNLARWGTITTFFVDMGYDVLVMDYRTYGKSTGKLSEAALYADAQLFYDYALDRYPENKITVYGRSLGTGIASYIGSKNKPAQLILETPYYSLKEVAVKRFPFLPVKWLLRYQFPSFQYVQNVQCPITIFHGTNDAVVAYESGARLYDSIPIQEKKLYRIEGGSHNNLIEFEGYRQGISEILDKPSIK
ncbi:alpha/beta hydrolase [Spongiimicrobium salis]|uniref:alpha/beta hydrolase n=1 Tax=Spongiimicrobium salis TaxID=1667022 RepID=UPI00374D569D